MYPLGVRLGVYVGWEGGYRTMAARRSMRCVLAFGLAQSVLAACDGKSCSSCASQTVAGFSCRWCPLDSSCHDPGSVFNPCSTSENYVYGVNCPEFQIADPSANWVSNLSSQVHRGMFMCGTIFPWLGYCRLPALVEFCVHTHIFFVR